MKILIAGASGLIGRYLINAFSKKNYKIIALSRNPQNQINKNNIIWKKWHSKDPSDWLTELESTDVVINLIGESIAEKRWTNRRKRILLNSRVDACNLFVRAFSETKNKPSTFIQSSAIGYYAPGEEIDEDSPAGTDFLADLTVKWEEATVALKKMGINRILLRTGIVLADESLIIKKFKLPFSFFIGGHLGNGQQIMSWIYIDDVVDSILFLLENTHSSQIYNLTAPNPVNMKEFCKKFGNKMRRPSWLHVPAFILKLLFGQVAKETMLKGHKILPGNLIKTGYNFKYSDIHQAINSLKSI